MEDGASRRDEASESRSDLVAAADAARRAAEHAEEWLDPLRSAAAAAVTDRSLAQVLNDALESIAEILQADEASILVAAPDGSELTARASIGTSLGHEITPVHIPFGRGFAGSVLASGEPRIVPDVREIEVYTDSLRASDLRSLVGVPLRAGGKTVGVIHAGSREVGRLGSDDVRLLTMLADPIAAAILRVQLFETERALRHAAEVATVRLTALQRITEALASARSVTEVCQTIIDAAFPAAPGTSPEAGIWILREGTLRFVAGGERSASFVEIPLDESLPAAENIANGAPLFVEDREDLIRRWPALEATDTCAFAGFSLQVEGRCLGVMSLGYTEDHVFDEGERAFLTAVAEQAAVALRRAQAGEVEEGARARRTFLAEASLKLTNRYAGPDQLLKTLVEIAVPRLADYCTVILRRRGRFEQVAFAHDLGEQSEKTLPLVGDIGEIVETGPALEVFLTGRPAVFGGGGTPLDPADFGPLAASIDMTSAMLVPLESHGRSVGVMSFIACGKHAAYRREDLELARELATRAGALVDDLAQRARDRQLAETLTRALLPARLPNVPGVEIAARYLPAESGPVGGDWYDVFELGDGRLALVVGDVGGHGVEAASTMIRLRNGMLAFVAEGHDAVTTFERLSLLLTAETSEWNLPDPIATLLYSTLDLSSWNLHTACAGHPPWLLLRGGHPEVVECGGRVLAGGLPASIAEQDYQLYPGDVAIFMTDGLIERPGEDLEHSFGRLTSALEGVRETDLGTLCDMALDATMPPLGRRDDCCLLALRLVPGQEEEVVVATSLANRASSMSSSVTPLAS